MSKFADVTKGNTYSVTPQVECEVYGVLPDETEVLLVTAQAGQQSVFQAVSDSIRYSEDSAVILPFAGAILLSGAGHGGGAPRIEHLMSGSTAELRNGNIYVVQEVADLSAVTIGTGSRAEVWVVTDEPVSIVWPESWKWLGGAAPDLAAGQHCISVSGMEGSVVAKHIFSV